LSPILGGIWLAVRLESPGPGFFRQRRGGFGQAFFIYKFRTMRTCEDRTISGKQGDDCTTRPRRALQIPIDELPQPINVLLGDMSIVGPRPHVRALIASSPLSIVATAWHHARPGNRPAQVSISRPHRYARQDRSAGWK
jgi:lipopolysaccharide/colanic/teichoic acid biosynthesis glycosyltransferase